MNTVIIGTGNVADVFGKLLAGAGYRIAQVFGRDARKAKQLADGLGSSSCSTWKDIDRQADLYLVALADKALYGLEQHLVLSEQLIIHTAGSVSREVLKNISSNYGVLYPLQSLRKGMPVITQVPLLVDGSSEETTNRLIRIAHSISSSVTVATDEQRLKYHVAAVFVNNFTNYLYTVAESYCRQENISFSMLYPLASETANRLETASPAQAATGPAVRNDEVTINRHLELLGTFPAMQALYRQLTESIRQWHMQE